MLIVISYDVEDDKRRARLAKILEGYGTRVQYSVFACHVDDRAYAGLKQELARLVVLAEQAEEVVGFVPGAGVVPGAGGAGGFDGWRGASFWLRVAGCHG